jgi:hypothetical protein
MPTNLIRPRMLKSGGRHPNSTLDYIVKGLAMHFLGDDATVADVRTTFVRQATRRRRDCPSPGAGSTAATSELGNGPKGLFQPAHLRPYSGRCVPRNVQKPVHREVAATVADFALGVAYPDRVAAVER